MFAFSALLDIGSGVPAIMSKVDDSHKEMDHLYWEICALSEHGRDVSGSLVITSYLQGGAPVRRS
ncbi:hypothetical protein FA13DRAFT_1726284 [Coprinellus micaceus]|uniref:Uncharacterized protein n=1 Tax=Coprinellus micaceus TaxID=71717 RepID=A0A4Y7TSP1_COPMI|nr:hypothetical protein FA13DRAFT_1726284 [Coprinellus micaceus]